MLKKEAFYSSLNDEGITDVEYQRAKDVYKKFDYLDLYVRMDTCLLADVFENFQGTCSKQYGLDPAHYFTGPGLSWDALLKHSGVRLESLTDYNTHLFIEKGLRGARDSPRQTILTWKITTDRNLRVTFSIQTRIDSIDVDSRKGYILEVDLEYPEELHDSHSAYPLAPESLVVPKES